jgi:Protein of unknown function (DUF3048) N-terminal domain/Protein of unknown function (DUF3048) C-terminal domain
LTLSKRGRWIAGGVAVVVSAAVLLVILSLTGAAPSVITQVTHINEDKPTCPLTGTEVKEVPDRPVLAVKVENLPEARPQAGLNKADIVYEEPVEGGITRFIVLYQCQDAERIGPVRSGRLTDPPVLVQYGHPLFGYAGGVPPVLDAIRKAGIKDVNFNIAADAYEQDPNRSAPHNTYTSTKALYKAGHTDEGPPDPVFSYDTDVPDHAKQVKSAHLYFSGSSDVYWKWDGKRGVWLRYHGDVPHTVEGDVQVAAKNVVIQVVKIKYTGIYDVAGSPSPEAITVGSGKAYVLRNGRVIAGKWTRSSEDDTTQLETKSGDEIKLAPGNTWVELYPNDRPPVELSK